jgi:hypothetical protein
VAAGVDYRSHPARPARQDQLFIENDFGRYSIGSTTEGLKTALDGH